MEEQESWWKQRMPLKAPAQTRHAVTAHIPLVQASHKTKPDDEAGKNTVSREALKVT